MVWKWGITGLSTSFLILHFTVYRPQYFCSLVFKYTDLKFLLWQIYLCLFLQWLDGALHRYHWHSSSLYLSTSHKLHLLLDTLWLFGLQLLHALWMWQFTSHLTEWTGSFILFLALHSLDFGQVLLTTVDI